jgi:ribonucleoside-diphosphate reductase beta chain
MTILVQKKIFDELGDDSLAARSIINGNAAGILNFNNVKYQWASKLYKIMVG